ncbi:TonB-dependent receptor plug domain-containing protein [Granulicella sp. 5B5]|uniref:TonB-dependent receptor n=1 Tax=Granulicella sp. 5B5 TaxID=1617967 RepID=UPI0015F69861|nr:TonB-dependent receptor [Granulicella sp. 5B5]QMV18999.1 TonB-dependent receptor plug domain-containing protein [Granulicella sp. 5B5]
MNHDRNPITRTLKPARFALAFLFLLMATAGYAGAQVDEGSIAGTVMDPTGAVVPGASVTVTNTDVGLKLQGTTNSAGEFTFSPVRIGHYSVTASAPGFQKTTQQNLTVNIAEHLQVPIQLKTGAISDTIEVTTEPPQLQTDESSVGQVVTEKTVNDLPLNGRNFTFLAQLGAGTQSAEADTRGNSASGAFSANGLRPAQNNYLLDGIDNNSNAVDFLNGTNFIVLPPIDAIAEFKVQTSDYSADLGRAAGAVLNASIKSGTNSLHGSVWEFFRNDVLDARDFFEPAGQKKAAFRQNQFGASIGGRIIKDKLFFFGDYEGLRRVQGQTTTATVPTLNEINSGYTNLADILNGQAGAKPQVDLLGRSIPLGAVLDPATTRLVSAGVLDQTSGIVTPQPTSGSVPVGTPLGYVRDPFAGNQIPAGRIDPVALKILSLFPKPTNSLYASNFVSSPDLYEHRNAFDVRVDYNASQKDQVFGRFSYVDDPQYIPGVFGGIADGGAFQQGIQTAHSNQSVIGYTHVFTPSTINVLHVGFNHLHTTRYGPEGGVNGIPAQYGIQGIPQFSENGGLPQINFGGLSTLGSNSYLPSDETSQTLQITDDFTKVYKTHSFKVGIESQLVKNDVLQPPNAKGDFDYNGTYTDVPAQNSKTTGLAQFLIVPEVATVPNGFDYSGGSDNVQASNSSKTDDYRTYLAGYIQDDWKATPKLTFNLGVRYDYFSPIRETNGGQANFVPNGPLNNGTPTYLIPASGKADANVASTYPVFAALLQTDGITLEQTDKYGQGLVQTQKTNVSPRIGVSYQASNKLVLRAGFGYFFNSFENQGYGPNIGENYPFQFQFNYSGQSPLTTPGASGVAPVSYNTAYAGNPTSTPPIPPCATAGPGQTASIGSGLSCFSFNPALVNPANLGLQGLQFDYKTPRTLSTNFSVEYALTRSLSATVAYVFTQAQHLQIGIGSNNVTAILPASANTKNPAAPGTGGTVPFVDFGSGASYQATAGSSNYNGLQVKLEQRYANGLSFLFAYTYSKTLSDALDLLNGGSLGGFRAPSVPGLGPSFDYGPADFDIRQVLHFSGGYELPFGAGKHFASSAGRGMNYLIGGWSANYILTLQGGQPITLGCPTATTAGTSCNDVRVPGQNPDLGIHITANGPRWFNNPAAFQQPCPLGAAATAGCIPLTGSAILGDSQGTVSGPGFHRLDFSLFKDIKFSERFRGQFRTEFFNIVNHPNFDAPGFGGNGVVSISGSTAFNNSNFGLVGATRDNPYDPRQIQFAFKLYY